MKPCYSVNSFAGAAFGRLLMLLLIPCWGSRGQTSTPEPVRTMAVANSAQTDCGLSGVVWDGERLVAVGGRGTILRSASGLEWERQEVDAKVCFRNVVSGNGMLLALTRCNKVVVSRDGVRWEERVSPGVRVCSAAFGNGLFVGVGEGGRVVFSSDAATWTAASTDCSESLLCVRFGGGKFVAVGTRGEVLTSPDGRRWTHRESGTERNLHGLTHGGGAWVAVGCRGTIVTSPDGEQWTSLASGAEESLRAVAFGDGTFLAVGRRGCLLASDDCCEWRTLPPCGVDLHDVTFACDTFVAVGDRGTILLAGRNLPGGSDRTSR